MLPAARRMERDGLWHTFPDDVRDEAERMRAAPPPDADEAIRADLRHLRVYCIDDEHTDEVDDGVSLEAIDGGRTRVWVHVADATRHLPADAGSLLLGEAQRRASTLYLPGDTVHMFPRSLAAGPMSLRVGTDCAALSVGMEFDEGGELLEERTVVTASVVVPSYQLTYDDADELLHFAPEEEAGLWGSRTWRRRRAMRYSAGALPLAQAGIAVEVRRCERRVRAPLHAVRAPAFALALAAGACADGSASRSHPCPMRRPHTHSPRPAATSSPKHPTSTTTISPRAPVPHKRLVTGTTTRPTICRWTCARVRSGSAAARAATWSPS